MICNRPTAPTNDKAVGRKRLSARMMLYIAKGSTPILSLTVRTLSQYGRGKVLENVSTSTADSIFPIAVAILNWDPDPFCSANGRVFAAAGLDCAANTSSASCNVDPRGRLAVS